MGKLVAFEWVSIDGVFDASNMDQWFFPYNSPERQRIIKETYQQADAFLMGDITYEMLAPHWSQLPDEAEQGVAGILTNTPKFVASSQPSVTSWGDTTVISENIEAEIEKLKHKVNNIMIIGSATLVESLASVGLIDEYKLLVHPFIMGSGRQFFSEKMKGPMEITEVTKLNSDILMVNYRVKK